jgi:hypothetical protein
MLHLIKPCVYICNIVAFNMIKFKSDWLGIVSASLCVVHCLFTPFLIFITSNFSWWYEASYLFLLISFFAAYEASNHTDSRIALSIIWSSFALLAVCLLFEEDYYILHDISYLASLGIILGHIYNLRYCKKCNHE